MKSSDLAAVMNAVDARSAVARIVNMSTGDVRLVRDEGVADDPLSATLREAFQTGRSRTVKTPAGELFVDAYLPPLRLVLVGAVHIAQALVPMASSVGYSVIVIDPRTAFATVDRFPNVVLDTRWPDKALADLTLDQQTAFCALTHDPKIDEPGLIAALASDAFYIGALGSSRTHEKRCERLREQGVAEDRLTRIHAPIGLNIGAVGAPEIAVSIMAEITQTLRQREVSG
ncbi:MAG: XdhC family protein [Rhodospirillales bacterium]